jgi:hypothetical protein
MRSLVPLLATAHVVGTYAAPAGVFDSAKSLLSQVNVLTGSVGTGVFDSVEALVERVWHGNREQRAQVSFVEKSGVRCMFVFSHTRSVVLRHVLLIYDFLMLIR